MKKGKIILTIASAAQLILLGLLAYDAFCKDKMVGVILAAFGIVIIIIENIFLFKKILNVIDQAFLEENKKMALMQTEFSKIQEENIEKQSQLENQFKQEMLKKICELESIIEKKEYEAANKQLRNIQASWESNPYYKIWCDNMLVNVLMDEKQKIANEYHIDMKATMSVPENLSILSTDLCSVLANLIDNALEASHLKEETKRWVRVKGAVKGGYLILKVENSFALGRDPQGEYRIFKRQPGEVHGIGLKIVEKIAEKYNGKLLLSHKKDRFTAIAYLKAEEFV